MEDLILVVLGTYLDMAILNGTITAAACTVFAIVMMLKNRK